MCTQSFIQAQIKGNIKAPRHWPLWGEFTVTGEFPLQRAVTRKSFHLMTSSCIHPTPWAQSNISYVFFHHVPDENNIIRIIITGLCYSAIKIQSECVHMILNPSDNECIQTFLCSWWRHQIKTFSALLVICARNSPVTGEFPTLRPVTHSFDVSFDPRLNKRLSKQWWGWWFETPTRPLWRHCNVQLLCCKPWSIKGAWSCPNI